MVVTMGVGGPEWRSWVAVVETMWGGPGGGGGGNHVGRSWVVVVVVVTMGGGGSCGGNQYSVTPALSRAAVLRPSVPSDVPFVRSQLCLPSTSSLEQFYCS